MATTASIAVTDGNPIAALRAFMARLLEQEDITAVLVNRHLPAKGSAMPALITDPAHLDEADPLAPSYPMSGARLAARLTRGEVEGRIAAIMRPCEVRAFVELAKLNQGALDNVLLLSFDCYGAYDNTTYRRFAQEKGGAASTQDFLMDAAQGKANGNDFALARACRACEHPVPQAADVQLGLFGVDMTKEILVLPQSPRGEALVRTLALGEGGSSTSRQAALDALLAERTAYRDAMFEETEAQTNTLEKLVSYLSGCVNCYNCRAACPVCYCKECVFLTDVFDHKPWQYLNWAKQKGVLKMPTDTVFFHMTRLAHMSTACVGCGQCSNACPNEVPVMELFRSVAHHTQAAFDYQPGRDLMEPPPMAVFQEKEFAEMTGGLE
ncbi:MAG: Coenzyme F420 hydrogenase/dehydrogenase, beta subunit C-terminal domain [Desulfovibrionaceae bacterium]